jgi:hypothetical protein
VDDGRGDGERRRPYQHYVNGEQKVTVFSRAGSSMDADEFEKTLRLRPVNKTMFR